MSGRAYYGTRGLSPSTLPEYYGPSGDDIAAAFAHRDERTRQMAKEKQQADEADLRMKGERYRQQHEQDTDPIADAIARAKAVEAGILLPGQGGAGQPAQPAPIQGRGGLGGKGNLQPQQDIYDMTPVAGTAHAQPGAFNPVTGTHNPADVDLGGGFRLSGEMMPGTRRAEDVKDLGGFGFNPEEADYLGRHPEHIAPFMERMYGNRAAGWHPQSYDEAVRFYRATHPNEVGPQPRGGLSMEQALLESRQMAASSDAARTGDEGDPYTYRGPLGGRDYLRAQQLYYGPGGSGYRSLTPPQRPAVARGAAPTPGKPAPRTPAGVSSPGNDRAAQILKIRDMIPHNASPAHVRAVLKKHGLSDDEISQVIGQRD